jgi:probable phosphoglycerate mutase
METAQIILEDRGGRITALPGMREISMGRWEGLSMEQARRLFPGEYERRGTGPACHRPPEGESFIDVRERVLPLFETILGDEEGPVLLVGHAGVNRVILCHILGVPLDNLFRFGQGYGCMNIIVREKRSLRVDAMNLRPWIGFSSGY